MKCNHDCFNCVFDDCVNDDFTVRELRSADDTEQMEKPKKPTYYERHKEERKAYAKKYQSMHADELKQKQKRYYQRNRDAIIESQRERYWRKKNEVTE